MSTRTAALLGAVCALASAGSAMGQIIQREIFYTRWNTNNAVETNVRKCRATYDKGAGTFVCDLITPLARTNGADGIIFAPDGDLLVGGQDSGFIHKVNPTTGTFTSQLTNTGASFHIVLDPGAQKAWTAGLPGQISEVPLNPFAAGTSHAVTGSVAGITDMVFVGGTTFYTSSVNSGNGSFGTINTATFQTTQILGPALESAHGMRFDPFTGHLLLCGGGKVIQIDPANPAVVLSTLDLTSLMTGPPSDRFLDQLAPDGQGLVYIAANDGTLFLVDYSGTSQIGHALNVVRAQLLDTFLDDIAPLIGGGSTPCCPIGTGVYDGQGGQSSQLPAPNPICANDFQFQAADDFFLCGNNIYQINSIEATMATDQTLAVFLKAGVKIYEDCDGRPGAEITFSSSNPDDRPVVTVIPTGAPYDANLNLVTVRATFPALWLRGDKSYWVSFFGTTCPGTNWVWTTAGNSIIQGRPAHFRSSVGGAAIGPWHPLDECCIGCTDLAFCVDAKACKILHDNGTYANAPIGGTKSIDNAPLTNFLAKTADDFVIPPCDPMMLCYIEAYIITNCEAARLDIYDNDCNLPAGTAPAYAPLYTLTPKRYIRTGQFIQFEGQQLEVIRLQFWGDNIVLPGGKNYWLSAYGKGSGNANQKALFAWNRECNNQCLIHFNAGAVRGPGFNLNSLESPLAWHGIQKALGYSKDFAFLVAVMNPDTLPPDALPACRPDMNGDGSVTIDDIFTFLNAWFAGCP